MILTASRRKGQLGKGEI